MFNIRKDGEIIDTKETLTWAKYISKNDLYIISSANEGEGILVGKYIEQLIDPEDENSGTELVYSSNNDIYIVKGNSNPKNLEEVTIEEIRDIDEKLMADVDYLAIMTGVDLNV